ncbi:MAG: TlpA disulfide reductase family protein [Bacteroidales bacterium]
MIKRFFLILSFAIIALALYGRGFTTIKGSIQGASGYQIRLLTWSDQITFIEKKLASATIDDQGHFNMIAELQATIYAFIAIGNMRAEIVLEPGGAYELQFEPYPPLAFFETRNPFLQREPLRYTILNAASDDINALAAEIDLSYNQFLSTHYMDLYLRKPKIIDAFIDTFFLQFGTLAHPWLRQMVDYKIASLKLSGYKITVDQAYEIWLKDQDIGYAHPDFMEFFNQLFSNYLTTRLKHYTYRELVEVVNQGGSFFALTELVGRDTVLRNEQLREMVILKGLGEIYHNRDFNDGNILKMLNYVAAASKFKEHRMIASNLIYLNTRFNKGIMAPDFSLPDQNGRKHSISDYRGKYVYVAFYMSNCIPCLAEFRYLESIYPSLQEKLEVVGVSLDPDTAKLWKTLQQQEFPWPILHFDNDFELTDRYQIKSYPFFILIAPDGSFDTYGARQPSAQFKAWFEEVVIRQN